MNTSCIRSFKASYKAKLGSKRRIQGMSEYQDAERETEREVRKECSRNGVALVLESGARATEEHSVWKARQVVSSVLVPRLPRVSLARRRLRKDLRLKCWPRGLPL